MGTVSINMPIQYTMCPRNAKMASTKTLTFKVTKKIQELISPARPTPYEFKYISDIDDQEFHRSYFSGIHFYRKNPSMEGKDPVSVLRDVVSKALVFYYPLAGRLREYAGRKLVVECTGEGVVFVEADADVMLHQFGDALYPPFPYLEELLPHLSNNKGIINSPLMMIQVTRLKCGGFILAYRFNHIMCDAFGILRLFLSAVAELARGAAAPSIPPAWERHLLTARRPPRVSFRHREYDVVSNTSSGGNPNPTSLDKMVERSFVFSTADISALRRTLPPHLQSSSKFEIVAGCAWRCRTIALSPKPDEEVRFVCVVDVRKRMKPPLPAGYYGNVVAFPTAVTSAGKLSENPLQYAVELVRAAKYEATDEYLRSAADLMAVRDRPNLAAAATNYLVSDVTNAGGEQLDFGWGTAEYGGAAKAVVADCIPLQLNWFVSFKNKKGEKGIVVPAYMPLTAMEEFVKQLQMMMTAARTSSAL